MGSGGAVPRLRLIELNRTSTSRTLGATSKLNRDPAFIRELQDHGRLRAEAFLTALAFEDAWSRGDLDSVLDHLADDAVVGADPPFGGQTVAAADALREFVATHVIGGITADATRPHTAGDEIVWSVRGVDPGIAPAMTGRLTATVSDGRMTSLRVGPAD